MTESQGPIPQQPQAEPAALTGVGRGKKVLAFLVIAVLFGSAFYFFRNFLDINKLAGKEAELRQLRVDYPVLVYGGAFAIYVTATALSLPIATLLTLVIAWYFGFWRALILVSFASTAGATLAFLFTRYFFRDAIQNKFGSTLVKFNAALEREGAYYLFSLRLIPVVPFFVINAVMGLTPLSVRTFWWVSQVGMLAGTGVYVYAGSAIPTLQVIAETKGAGIMQPEIFIALCLLGLFPIVVKKLIVRVKSA